MKDKLLAQIQNINAALTWLRTFKPDYYDTQSLQLVDERRRLARLVRALDDNPSISAFGESQVGKSHVMNNILQDDGRPFMVEADGRAFNFVEEINPIGNGQEATGVVTRFSSFTAHPDLYSSSLPVLMRPLTVKDLLLVICDDYFNDYVDYTTFTEQEIIKRLDGLRVRYADCAALPDARLTADDVLDIREYFTRHINNAQVFWKNTAFFDHLALLADRIPETDYVEAFSILWHDETAFTCLFSNCLDVLRTLHFSRYVYLPITAVVHGGRKHDTVMSVECLKRFFADAADNPVTEVFLRDGDAFVSLGKVAKSRLCAVCAEVDFFIPETYYRRTGTYCFDRMPVETRRKLGSPDVSMDILRDNDLLDFPGARSRGNDNIGVTADTDKLVYGFLRGKVAYLFNKYNEDLNINVLLYCHHEVKCEVKDLWLCLQSWVHTYVGATPDDRATTLRETGGIAPLFYVATKFNNDMANSINGSVGDNEESLRNRWKGRFKTVLLNDCFNAAGTDWVDNWTASGDRFRNSYLLRDFKYSTTLYTGLRETGHETDFNAALGFTPAYYDTLRRTFIGDANVAALFADPALSWDVAATQGNDGALFIVHRLSLVAARMKAVRHKRFERLMATATDAVDRLMRMHHVDERAEKRLDENIFKARCVARELDFACNSDNYFFGHMVRNFQLTEAEGLQAVHRLIHSGGLNRVNDYREYELIRKSCDNFSGCATDADKARRLNEVYAFGSDDEAEAYLKKKGVDRRLLFTEKVKRKLPSNLVAECVLSLWNTRLHAIDLLTRGGSGEGGGFDPVVMNDLVQLLADSAVMLGLEEHMSDAIADYVNVLDPTTANEHLVADILTSQVNEFVINFGYSLLSSEAVGNARRTAADRHLPVFDYIDRKPRTDYGEDELSALFDAMNDGENTITTAFEDHYNSWKEYMYVAFIAHVAHQNFDREANRQLADLLERIAHATSV